MDDYLSEKEQIERIRAWWKENGAWIIIGVGVGVLGLAGWNWWKAHKIGQAEQASAIYTTLTQAASAGRTGDARAELDRLTADYAGTPYADQGRLALAGAFVLAGEPAEAGSLLEEVMTRTSDPELALVARLRLARLLASTGEGDRALEIAGISDAGPFGSALAEVRVDVLAERGDVDGARAAYEEALEGVAEGGVIDEAFVRMKLEALGGGTTETEAS